MVVTVKFVGVAALGLLALYHFYRLLRVGSRPKDYPPGPPTIPILGNIHLMPKENVHLQFQKWAEEYGPVYSLMLGSKCMIVLSNDQAIKDLLDRKSAIYSDRPDLFMAHGILSGGLRILTMPYSPTWRMIRRIIHNLLNIHAARSYEPYQVLENEQMLHDLLVEPNKFKQHVRRYANSLTTAITFGFRTPTYQDKHLQDLFTIFGEFAVLAQTGTAALLDYLPALRWIPDFLLPHKRRAKELHQKEKALYRFHWDNAKAAIKAGTSNPCFCRSLAKEQETHSFSDDQAAYISGTLLEAGSDTTANTLYGFICAMIVFPEVQKRAQAELDRVIGSERMPTTDDEPDLHYIRGCVKESLRWMPTTIMGAVPHALTRDDWYMGYRLPAGTGVLNNVYTLHNDARRYSEPWRFAPERFAEDTQSAFDAALNADVSKRDHFTFGAGRRICPGMHVAERSLFLGIARMLWAFEFKRPVGEDGKEIVPDPTKVTQGFVCAPEPFRAIITPRDEKRAEAVRSQWEKAVREHLDPDTMQWKHIPEAMKNAYSGGKI